MNNATTSPQNRNIDQILDESNLQGFIAKNKAAFIGLIVLIVAGVIGFGIYNHYNDKSQTAFNSKIYTFETTTLKTYMSAPTDPNAVAAGMDQLAKEMGDYLGLVPVVIKTSDALVANNHLAEAKKVLAVGENAADNDYARYYILSRKAAVLEDLGDNQGAIDVLLKLNSQSTKIFEAKNYVDLGRLYLKVGDKEKARSSFQYVVENAKEEAEFVKVAQLYLAKL